MRVTAIIPTRDRGGLLRDCLATLVTQDVPKGFLEVIVVDDGSDDDLGLVVDEFHSNSMNLHYVRQEPAGLNVARNRGAELSKGQILAFLDDDTLVAPGWARAVEEGFERFRCDGMAGRIVLRLEGGNDPPWLTPRLRSYLSELELGLEARWMAPGSVPYGANCAVTRSAFDTIGGFRAGLDRIGQSLVSNGDVDFFTRLQAIGGRIVYLPQAKVIHRVSQERLTIDWFLRRAFAQGISDAIMMGEAHPGRKYPKLIREIIRMGRAGPILIRNSIQGQGAVGASIWVAYCKGRMATVLGRMQVS